MARYLSSTQWLRWTLTSQRIHGILTSQRIHWSSSRLRHSDLSPHISVLVAIYTICWAQSLVTRDFQQGGRVPGFTDADPGRDLVQRGGHPLGDRSVVRHVIDFALDRAGS